MKSLILFLSIFNLSCATSSSEEKKTFNDELKHQAACEAIDLISLTKTFGWVSADIMTQDLGYNEKRTACSFIHNEEKLFIRLGWKSEKAEEMKTVENRFKTFLQNGENGIVYESIEAHALILGKKSNRFGTQMYILRKRFGNKAEAQIEFNSANANASEIKEKLLKLMEML